MCLLFIDLAPCIFATLWYISTLSSSDLFCLSTLARSEFANVTPLSVVHYWPVLAFVNSQLLTSAQLAKAVHMYALYWCQNFISMIFLYFQTISVFVKSVSGFAATATCDLEIYLAVLQFCHLEAVNICRGIFCLIRIWYFAQIVVVEYLQYWPNLFHQQGFL